MAAANVASMFEYWKNFDLPQLQRELDTTATELANRQDEAESSRKKLVEMSRDFKKNTPDDVRKVVSPVIKSFQSEIDSLSKRSKAAEAAFLSIYKKLIDLPDPVPVLEHGLNTQKRAQKATDLEIENQKLRETLDEYNQEFAEVKNQEVTIKNLRDKVKEYEEKMEAVAESRAKEKEKELQRSFANKERQLQETQMSVATKLGEAEHKIQQLQSALETSESELFEIKSKMDEQSAAKSDEVDILTMDLERASQKQVTAEKELEALKGQLQSTTQSLQQAEQMQKAPNVEQAIDILTRSSLEVELSAKEKEISQLVEDVQRLQASNTKLRDSTASQVQKLEEQLTQRNTAYQKLEEKIRNLNDYDEIKRELMVLKSIEFNSGGEGASSSTSSSPGKGDKENEAAAANPKSLEVLLLEKNRALQTENTTLKVSNSERNGTSSSGGSGEMAQAQAIASLIGQEVAAYTQSTSTTKDGQHIIQPIIVIPQSFQSPAAAAAAAINNSQIRFAHQAAVAATTPPRIVGSPTPPPAHIHPEMKAAATLNQLAMSHEWIDTINVASRIKEVLMDHNIGQRLFGEHVLGLSQGSVSDILSRPKLWEKLTLKGREPFVKMMQFLSDPSYMERLKVINSQKKGKDLTTPTANSESASFKPSTEEAVNNILALAKEEMEHRNIVDRTVIQSPKVPTNTPKTINSAVELPPVKSPAVTTAPTTFTIVQQQTQYLRDGDSDEIDDEPTNLSISSKSPGSLSPAILARREIRKSLPALTPQQYDENKCLDPLDIARQVREKLARGNIPQRVFGDFVIGLSQGSVSDILSKPKRWDKLTVKGREPYIRMQMWLSDPEGLLKLKDIVRNSNYIMSDMPEDMQGSNPGSPIIQASPTSDQVSIHDEDSNSHPSPINTVQALHESVTKVPQSPSMVEKFRPPTPDPLPELVPVHEQAAMIEYLDTFELTRQVKNVLQQHGVGQKAFGEAVLGLTQGSVSDLLSKPKMWLKLSMKGREPYIRMYLWLQDKDGIERVKSYKPRRKPKRLSFVDTHLGTTLTPMKRPRLLLTPEEKDTLLTAYNKEPYPAQSTVEELAATLKLPHSTVVNWFHNHRSRLKRSHTNNEELLANTMLAQAADGSMVPTEELYATVVSSPTTETAAPSVVSVPASSNKNKRKATSPVQITQSNGTKSRKVQNNIAAATVQEVVQTMEVPQGLFVIEQGGQAVIMGIQDENKDGEEKDDEGRKREGTEQGGQTVIMELQEDGKEREDGKKEGDKAKDASGAYKLLENMQEKVKDGNVVMEVEIGS